MTFEAEVAPDLVQATTVEKDMKDAVRNSLEEMDIVTINNSDPNNNNENDNGTIVSPSQTPSQTPSSPAVQEVEKEEWTSPGSS